MRHSLVVGGGFGDILVQNGGAKEHAYGMYKKQSASIGCPHWVRERSLIETYQALACLAVEIIQPITHFIGTDSGPDEDAFKRDVVDATAKNDFPYCIGGPCLLHQYHLMTEKALKLHG